VIDFKVVGITKQLRMEHCCQMSLTEQTSLDTIATSLLEGRGDRDLQLPSVDGMVAIAADLRNLLFPGYRQTRHPSGAGQVHQFSNTLRCVQSRLRIEIGRALSHARQSMLRIHNSEESSETLDRCPSVLANRFLATLPDLRRTLDNDVQAAFDRDPAARTNDEILLCYPGLDAVLMHRLAHELHRLEVPFLPRILAEWAHRETGIDIHPAAKIGPSFFIDHGTGVVIGETTQIGSGVTLYQGVTLGAWSFPRDEQGNLIRGAKRHPTLEDNVTVYSNATVLGGMTTVGAGSQIGSSVTLGRSIPPNTIVTIEKPVLRFREAG